MMPSELQRAFAYPLPRVPRGLARLAAWTPMFVNFSFVVESVGWALRGALACSSRTFHHTVAMMHHRTETQRAAVCALSMVNPGADLHSEFASFMLMVNWVRRMGPQADRLHLHLANNGSLALQILRSAVPRQLEDGKLVAHVWDWPERFATLTNGGYAHMSSGFAAGDDFRAILNILKNHAWNKCIIEEEEAVDYMLVADTDEGWGHAHGATRSDGGRLVMRYATDELNKTVFMHVFCAVETGVDCGTTTPEGKVKGRMKTMYRLDSSECEWWATAHTGIPLAGSKPGCHLHPAWQSQNVFMTKLVDSGFDRDHPRILDPEDGRLNFGEFMNGPGCDPLPRGYVLHDRQTNWLAEEHRRQPCRNHSLNMAKEPWAKLYWDAIPPTADRAYVNCGSSCKNGRQRR